MYHWPMRDQYYIDTVISLVNEPRDSFFGINLLILHNFSNGFLLNYRYLRKWMYIIPNVYAKNEGHLFSIVIWKGKVTQSIWHKWFYFYTIKMILEKTLCLEAHLFSIFSPIQEDLYDASFIKRFFITKIVNVIF